jgi:hypothetical protein
VASLSAYEVSAHFTVWTGGRCKVAINDAKEGVGNVMGEARGDTAVIVGCQRARESKHKNFKPNQGVALIQTQLPTYTVKNDTLKIKIMKLNGFDAWIYKKKRNGTNDMRNNRIWHYWQVKLSENKHSCKKYNCKSLIDH